MPKRVSIKGRGADLFFGDYEPGPATTPSNGAEPPEDVADEGEPVPVRSIANHTREAPAAPQRPARPSTSRSTAQSTDRSTNQSIDQLTDPSIAQATEPPFDSSPILGKPKGFYITEQQDEDLNTAVVKLTARLKGRGTHKVDRSTVVRLLLEVSNVTDDRSINRLANRLVNRLVNQLTG
jgi:hypothetical protein